MIQADTSINLVSCLKNMYHDSCFSLCHCLIDGRVYQDDVNSLEKCTGTSAGNSTDAQSPFQTELLPPCKWHINVIEPAINQKYPAIEFTQATTAI